MDDLQIINLYWNRDEKALRVTADQYGTYCYAIAYGILNNQEDSHESVNDTYWEAWNKMPPQKPPVLKTFLGRLTRCISIDRWRKKHAGKRGGGVLPEILEELSECTAPDGDPIHETEKQLLRQTVNRFIRRLNPTEQGIFLRRYWYAEPVRQIAGQYGFSESKVKSMLMRTRKKLREQLESEGLL